MIKIALKHWIYERCIDMLFDNIARNFKVIRTKIKVGDYYRRLVTDDTDLNGTQMDDMNGMEFVGVKVLDILPDGEVKIRCSYYEIMYTTGELFSEDDEHIWYVSQKHIVRLDR